MQEMRRILLVDPSKVVRSAIAKRLRGNFEVREEADSDAAWQAIVLDASICAVVASANLPRSTALELLERIRASKLHRICDTPFLLLVSGHETAEERLRAREYGITDFISRDMSKEEMLTCIGRLVSWEVASTEVPEISHIKVAAKAEKAEPPPLANTPALIRRNKPMQVKAAAAQTWEPLATEALYTRIDEALIGSAAQEGLLGIISFGLDEVAGSHCGPNCQSVLPAIARRLAGILKSKVGANDSIACDDQGRCIIVAPGSSQATCVAFAQRVCRGLAQSHISVGGTPINLKISAGIVSMPADASTSNAIALLALANDRLRRAQEMGGNQVVTSDRHGPEFAFTPDYLFSLSRLCSTSPKNVPMGALGLQLMPLIRAIDKSMAFGLPLDNMEQRFAERARQEGKV